MHRSNRSAPELMPILSAGRHRNPARGACFMEYASFLAGERWSDHPACTHPLLATLARDVNDLTTDAHRNELLPLVHRVVGINPPAEGYSAEVALLAAFEALPIVSHERQRALAVGMLSLLPRVEDAGLGERARDILDDARDTERWARRYLAESHAPRGPWTRAAEAVVHTAAVGMALACVTDPDAPLRAALLAAIEAGERRTLSVQPTEGRVLVAG